MSFELCVTSTITIPFLEHLTDYLKTQLRLLAQESVYSLHEVYQFLKLKPLSVTLTPNIQHTSLSPINAHTVIITISFATFIYALGETPLAGALSSRL